MLKLDKILGRLFLFEATIITESLLRLICRKGNSDYTAKHNK